MDIITSAPEAFTRMWTILRTSQRTRRNLIKSLVDQVQVASILSQRQNQLGVVAFGRIAQAFWSARFGGRKDLWFDNVARRRHPDLLIHVYASDRAVIKRLCDRTRVRNRLNRRARDPELLEWAKSNAKAVASGFGTWPLPLIMAANDHPAQIRSAVAPVKACVMVRVAKQQRPGLLNGLNASIVNERTVHRSSAPLPFLQTESRQ
jgi:hypothetical protein